MDEWNKFLAHSLGKRLDADKFEKYAQLLSHKHPLSFRNVADVLLRPNKHNDESLDPQIPQYVQKLLLVDLLDIPSVLRALFKYSSFRPLADPKPDGEASKDVLRWQNSYIQAEGLIYGLSKIMSGGLRPKTREEALGTIQALTEWTKMLVTTSAAENMMQEAPTTEVIALRIAVGTLIIAASENVIVTEVLGRAFPKGIYLLLNRLTFIAYVKESCRLPFMSLTFSDLPALYKIALANKLYYRKSQKILAVIGSILATPSVKLADGS